MASYMRLQAGDKVLVGQQIVEVSADFADSIEEGDVILGISSSGALKRIPASIHSLVTDGVTQAASAFSSLSVCSDSSINAFFDSAADLLASDSVFDHIATANAADVSSARSRGRSTTRLVLSSKMRADMVSAFRMWRDLDLSREEKLSEVIHDGWTVEQWRTPLGVLGFVFEGRPNVFADATGVLKGGNTVVFRIGSDALATARAIMSKIITPSLKKAGLPEHAVVLLDSPEHAAGWSLFSQKQLALAVARGSGSAVSELGSIAQQSGIAVSLHGTGGAWMVVGETCNSKRLSSVVEYSLDRKVCNTLNTICIPRSRAEELIPIVFESAHRAGRSRGRAPRIHAVNGAEEFLPQTQDITVIRDAREAVESQISVASESDVGREFEWEENPEFAVAIVNSVSQAVDLFNAHSPQFVVSVISESEKESEYVWTHANAPFVGDGFTRWVDGQFALLRPELGLSNWETGRLFARSGILSGDSAFTVRLRVRQANSELHR
ncbi:MAG: aldehyde dehydrogenase family protein [Ilumatobacteraceae bacterium]